MHRRFCWLTHHFPCTLVPWPIVSNTSKTPGRGGRGAIDKRERLASANACVKIGVGSCVAGAPQELDGYMDYIWFIYG